MTVLGILNCPNQIKFFTILVLIPRDAYFWCLMSLKKRLNRIYVKSLLIIFCGGWFSFSDKKSLELNSKNIFPTQIIHTTAREITVFCHSQTGTQICLCLYVALSIFAVIFGMKSTITWLLVPIFVVSLAVYAFLSHRHKYLYPFLIITASHLFFTYFP